MAKKIDNRPVIDRLNEVGVFLRPDEPKAERQKPKRLLIDKDGNELGWFSPVNAMNKFVHKKK